MGNNLFNADIAGQLAANLGPLLASQQLVKVTTGGRGSDPSAGPTTTETTFTCRGIVDSYRDGQFDETIIKRGDRKIMILGATLPNGIRPEPGDKIIAEGNTYVIVNVGRDPDEATFTCQSRGA